MGADEEEDRHGRKTWKCSAPTSLPEALIYSSLCGWGTVAYDQEIPFLLFYQSTLWP